MTDPLVAAVQRQRLVGEGRWKVVVTEARRGRIPLGRRGVGVLGPGEGGEVKGRPQRKLRSEEGRGGRLAGSLGVGRSGSSDPPSHRKVRRRQRLRMSTERPEVSLYGLSGIRDLSQDEANSRDQASTIRQETKFRPLVERGEVEGRLQRKLMRRQGPRSSLERPQYGLSEASSEERSRSEEDSALGQEAGVSVSPGGEGRRGQRKLRRRQRLRTIVRPESPVTGASVREEEAARHSGEASVAEISATSPNTEATTVEATTVEATTVEASTVEASTVEASTVEATTVVNYGPEELNLLLEARDQVEEGMVLVNYRPALVRRRKVARRKVARRKVPRRKVEERKVSGGLHELGKDSGGHEESGKMSRNQGRSTVSRTQEKELRLNQGRRRKRLRVRGKEEGDRQPFHITTTTTTNSQYLLDLSFPSPPLRRPSLPPSLPSFPLTDLTTFTPDTTPPTSSPAALHTMQPSSPEKGLPRRLIFGSRAPRPTPVSSRSAPTGSTDTPPPVTLSNPPSWIAPTSSLPRRRPSSFIDIQTGSNTIKTRL